MPSRRRWRRPMRCSWSAMARWERWPRRRLRARSSPTAPLSRFPCPNPAGQRATGTAGPTSTVSPGRWPAPSPRRACSRSFPSRSRSPPGCWGSPASPCPAWRRSPCRRRSAPPGPPRSAGPWPWPPTPPGGSACSPWATCPPGAPPERLPRSIPVRPPSTSRSARQSGRGRRAACWTSTRRSPRRSGSPAWRPCRCSPARSSKRPGPVLALVGRTAAGKTALALALAPSLGAEIVSADAMLVYRGMDIGTAKPTPEQRARVPHHLVDVVEPSEEFSVARFQPLARAAIAGVLARGAVPLLVGGSGLYFHAVVDPFVFPPTDPAVRARLETEAAEVGLPALYRRLVERDPEAARRIQPANLRRIVRALEVIELTGRRFSFYRGAMDQPVSRYRLTVLGLDPGPELLRARVAERVAAMAEAGLVDEVRRLAAGPLSRTARQALGYKELLDALERDGSVSGALAEVVARTRAYARRQLAWFRRDPRVRWSTLPPGPQLAAWALAAFTQDPPGAPAEHGASRTGQEE